LLVAASQPSPANHEPYESITDQQMNAVQYNDLEPDDSTTTPVAANLDDLDPAGRQRIADLRAALANWPPGQDSSPTRRVRNLLSAAAIADLAENQYEGAIAYVVFDKLKADTPRDDLKKILTWIIDSPDDDTIIVAVPELGIEGNPDKSDVNVRVKMYARKLLERLLGKLPTT
jgi:hypothetical protein